MNAGAEFARKLEPKFYVIGVCTFLARGSRKLFFLFGCKYSGKSANMSEHWPAVFVR